VVVPYAEWLAQRVVLSRPSHLRLFDRLLRSIEASAWLHQFQRPRDAQGRIIATVADCAVACRAMERALQAGAKELTGKREEVLEALARLSREAQDGWVSLRQVAKEVGRSPGTVRKHLRALVRKGYAAAAGDGGPFRPEAEPPEASPLPTAAELAAAFPHLAAVAPGSGDGNAPFSDEVEELLEEELGLYLDQYRTEPVALSH